MLLDRRGRRLFCACDEVAFTRSPLLRVGSKLAGTLMSYSTTQISTTYITMEILGHTGLRHEIMKEIQQLRLKLELTHCFNGRNGKVYAFMPETSRRSIKSISENEPLL